MSCTCHLPFAAPFFLLKFDCLVRVSIAPLEMVPFALRHQRPASHGIASMSTVCVIVHALAVVCHWLGAQSHTSLPMTTYTQLLLCLRPPQTRGLSLFLSACCFPFFPFTEWSAVKLSLISAQGNKGKKSVCARGGRGSSVCLLFPYTTDILAGRERESCEMWSFSQLIDF